ncbi:MAG: MBL fold metallo-hydrolase, partial [Gammaproteobacteria bacterium]
MSAELRAGDVAQVAPGVRRLVAPNPGFMTGPGTNTYLIGEAEVAVIDPGPYIEAHVDAIRGAAPGPIRWILVTHTHRD